MAQDKIYPGIVDLVSSIEGHWHYHITKHYLVSHHVNWQVITESTVPAKSHNTFSFSKFPIFTVFNNKKGGEFS